MSGNVRNVIVEDIHIEGCESGLYIKSMMGRGGVVEDVHFRNIYINRTQQAIRLTMNYKYRRNLASSMEDGDEEIPHFRNIFVSNVIGENVSEAGVFTGLNTSTIENVHLSNINISSQLGFKCEFVTGTARDVTPSAEHCFQ